MVSRAVEVILLTFAGLSLVIVGLNYLLTSLNTAGEVSGLSQVYEEINNIVITYEKGLGVINPTNKIILRNETETKTTVRIRIEDKEAGISLHREFTFNHPALYMVKYGFPAENEETLRIISGGNISASRQGDVRFIALSRIAEGELWTTLIPRLVIISGLKYHFGREAYNIIIQIPRFIIYSGGDKPVSDAITGEGGRIRIESTDKEAAPPVIWFGKCIQVSAVMRIDEPYSSLRLFKLYQEEDMHCLDEQAAVIINFSYKYYILTIV